MCIALDNLQQWENPMFPHVITICGPAGTRTDYGKSIVNLCQPSYVTCHYPSFHDVGHLAPAVKFTLSLIFERGEKLPDQGTTSVSLTHTR